MKGKSMKNVKTICAVTAMIFTATSSLICSAETIEPRYPMHGNRCGEVRISNETGRNAHIKITQNGVDGSFVYYDEEISDGSFELVLEGNDQVDYTVTIGAPKYIGSKKYKEFSESFTVHDTDEMDSDVLYVHSYSVQKNDTDEVSASNEKIETDSTIETDTLILFPISDKLLGDANNDGNVNVRDCAFIANAIAQKKSLPDNADHSEDGNVNVRDAASLARLLAERR